MTGLFPSGAVTCDTCGRSSATVNAICQSAWRAADAAEVVSWQVHSKVGFPVSSDKWWLWHSLDSHCGSFSDDLSNCTRKRVLLTLKHTIICKLIWISAYENHKKVQMWFLLGSGVLLHWVAFKISKTTGFDLKSLLLKKLVTWPALLVEHVILQKPL